MILLVKSRVGSGFSVGRTSGDEKSLLSESSATTSESVAARVQRTALESVMSPLATPYAYAETCSEAVETDAGELRATGLTSRLERPTPTPIRMATPTAISKRASEG